jgi:prevent-host-death family protein
MMETLNIHEAKTHLSRLLDRIASSGGFIIAKAGRPIARVVPLDAPDAGQTNRLGFMQGQLALPADFDRMGAAEIETLFDGDA